MKSKPSKDTALLWVKLPSKQATQLADMALVVGISRADLMRIILTNFINDKDANREIKLSLTKQ